MHVYLWVYVCFFGWLSTATMTTISTYTVSAEEKYPTVYHREFLVEQRDPTYTAIQSVPTQSALLLKGVGEQYTLVTDHAIPAISKNDEILVKVHPSYLCSFDFSNVPRSKPSV